MLPELVSQFHHFCLERRHCWVEPRSHGTNNGDAQAGRAPRAYVQRRDCLLDKEPSLYVNDKRKGIFEVNTRQFDLLSIPEVDKCQEWVKNVFAVDSKEAQVICLPGQTVLHQHNIPKLLTAIRRFPVLEMKVPSRASATIEIRAKQGVPFFQSSKNVLCKL